MWGNVGNRRNMRQPLQGSPECQKVEVQEALPPAGVIGAESLTLVPQHFSRKALFAGAGGQFGVF